MIKSKIILPYKICLIVPILTFAFVFYKIKKEPISIYTKKEITFKGIIEEMKIEENILTITLKAEEKLLLKYKIKSEKEKNTFEKYKLGNWIKGKGLLEKENTNRNFHIFSYQKYLQSKKIYRKCNVEKFILYKENPKIHYKIKNKIIKKVNRSKNKAYYYTFLLGNTSFIKKEVKESYLKNGMSHLFAISGMHISLFSFLILQLFKKIFSKETICYFICICFLFFYAFLANFTPSVLRSTIFFTLLFLKRLFSLKINPIFIYIFLTCFFLWYNPYFVYHTGFLYSFTISFFLLCYGKKFCKKKFLHDLFIVSFLSFIAALPIQINTNFEINIMSLFLNILFVPLVSQIIFPFTLFCFCIPLDFILTPLLTLLENLSLFFSHFSLIIIFPKMSKIEIVFYYFLIFFLFTCHPKKLYLIFLFLLYLYIKPYFYQSFMTMIDVGQGDSFLLHHNHQNILIDTGGKSTYLKRQINYYKAKEIILYLKSKGIRKIDAIFLSHGDIDHMGDALYLVKHFPVKKVILNKGKDNYLEKNLLKYLQKEKIPYKRAEKGKLKVGKNTFYILNKKNTENENEDSLILYTKIRKYNILFMGDASIKNEKEILNAYNLPKMDILKIGHHGSETSSSFSFIKKIKPTYSLISVGQNNKYNHPSKKVLQNLKKVNSKIYRTDIHGMVEIKLKNKLVIRSLLR